MSRRWIALAGAVGGLCVALAAYAASPVVNETVAIVDPTTPSQQATVTASGALKVDGSSAGGGAVTQSGTWTVQPGNTPNTSAWLVQPVAGATGGASSSFLQPAASDNHATIKAGAGTLYGVIMTNNSVTWNYLRYYDATTAFNGCNSATGLITQIGIPPSGGGSPFIPVGAAFATGLSICVTSGYATNDTTNATASAMSITTLYK
jgi:hypothetical protein